MSYKLRKGTVLKAFVIGTFYSLISIFGDLLFFSEDGASIIGALVFRATATLLLVLGVLIIMLDILDIELVTPEEDEEDEEEGYLN